MWLLTIGLLSVLAGLIYTFLVWNFGCWKKRGIREAPAAVLVGSYPSAFTQKRHMVWDLDDIYRKYKKDENFVGIFSCRSPQLLITTPEMARRVLVTDFKCFHDNEASLMVDKKSDMILANNPFTLAGNEWKEARAEISPGLSNNRIKAVYPVTQKVCKNLSNFLREQIRAPPKEGIDAKDLCLRFTSEIVSDCVLGIHTDSFSREPSPIMNIVKKIFDQGFILIFYQLLVGIVPWIRHIYKMRFIPKNIEDFFVNLVHKAIEMRRAGPEKVRERSDYLNYLMQVQAKKQLSSSMVASHMLTFLLDGFETTAAVITHCLLLLARNQEQFLKLRKELESHLDASGELDFDTLCELPYLDACVHESIRIFPPGLFTNRLCTQSTEFTNKDGRTLRIEKGQVVVVPLASFMFDEEHYPEPQTFRPERFLEEPDGLKQYRDRGLYYGFGDGPRVCLGMRFALVQAKAAVAEIVRHFDLRVNPKTRSDNKLDPAYFLARLDGGVWLDIEARE